MKQLVTLSFFILVTPLTLAAPAKKADAPRTIAANKGSNSKCPTQKELEARFNSYNYFKAPVQAAYDVESVDSCYLRPFQASYEKRTVSDREFTDLILLIAAASPYDQEGMFADMLASFLKTKPELKPIYDKALPQIAEACRRQDLTELVDAVSCVAKERANGTWEKEGTMGTSVCDKDTGFYFEDCLKKSSGKSNHGK